MSVIIKGAVKVGGGGGYEVMKYSPSKPILLLT